LGIEIAKHFGYKIRDYISPPDTLILGLKVVPTYIQSVHRHGVMRIEEDGGFCYST
jgi:hypothetical protein